MEWDFFFIMEFIFLVQKVSKALSILYSANAHSALHSGVDTVSEEFSSGATASWGVIA